MKRTYYRKNTPIEMIERPLTEYEKGEKARKLANNALALVACIVFLLVLVWIGGMLG